MRASAIIALFAAAASAVAVPQEQAAAADALIARASQAAASATAAPSAGGGAKCNFISCVTALGSGGAKCVDFAFGGSGRDCVQGVLNEIEHMPQACSDCLNALFLS